jgi:hypothetical protein
MPVVTWQLTLWNDPNPRNATRFEVDVDPAEITGSRGVLGAQLHLWYRVQAHGPALHSGPTLLSLGGWLQHARDERVPGGLLVPQQPCHPNDRRLHVPITDEQIKFLEDARAGGALQLILILEGMAAVHYSSADADAPPLLGVQSVRNVSMAGKQVTIGREQWLGILAALGGERRRLVELPELRLPRHDARWAACLQAFDRAVRSHREGEYERAIADCREVFEGVVVTLADQWGVPRPKGRSFAQWSSEVVGRATAAWPADAEATRTLAELLSALFRWTSPTHHFGGKLPLRQESAFALSLAQALVEFIATILEVHPEPLRHKIPRDAQPVDSTVTEAPSM